MKTLFYFVLSFLFLFVAKGQELSSVHKHHLDLFGQKNVNYSEKQWDSINHYKPSKLLYSNNLRKGTLKKIVFGWHPYWSGTLYNEYDFSMLTDVAYFSYEVDPNTGKYTTIRDWRTTPLVDKAKAAGVRVSLTVTLFSGHAAFFTNSTSQQTLTDSVISLVKLRGANGVNLDLEAVPSAQRDNMSSFIKYFGTRFHAEVPGSLISLALPAVNWSSTFDVKAMLPYIDLFVIMGYDYYYSGSSKAGPCSPKNNGKTWTAYDVTRSIRYYLQNGVPNMQLCLGVPYYGHEWATVDSLPNSSTKAKAISRTYKDAITLANSYGRLWNRDASIPYYVYKSNNSWSQCWFEDSTSLSYKYDLVNSYNIAGIGIWALGYDAGRKELWSLIGEKFAQSGNNASSGAFTDMGGPEGNYFSNDKYLFSIPTKSAGDISTSFTDFKLNDTDTLYAFSGNSENSLMIGKFSGTQSPFVVTSSTGEMSFKFVSNSAAPLTGWQAYWACGQMLKSNLLQLSQNNIAENSKPKTFIGKLVIDNGQINNKFSFYGTDYPDNSNFIISNDTLYSSKPFDYETRNQFFVAIQGEDIQNRKVVNSFTISVTDVTETTNFASLQDSPTEEVLIFPNPTTDFVYFTVSETYTNKMQSKIDVFDAIGRKLNNIQVIYNEANKNYSVINLSHLPEGIYFIIFRLNDKTFAKKIILTK